MTKPILIMKTGSSLPDLVARRGDFEDWIINGSGQPPSRFMVVDVEKSQSLPAVTEVEAVIITGSHAMVTDHEAWSEKAAQWLAEAVRCNLPVLGICYGHQLLAYALGGEVAYNPNGREYGSTEIRLSHKARADRLFKVITPHPTGFVSHAQTVLRLPEHAVHLAFSEKDTNQAFCFNHTAWGVQFHPEFDADITRSYIESSREALKNEGGDPDLLLAGCQDTPLGAQVLHRFIEIIGHPDAL
ncbi:MAG: glutamine amidotransferase [Anaerolineae bacterium]|nr:glutamine amidotransferase [Anaerolineae bacterium]